MIFNGHELWPPIAGAQQVDGQVFRRPEQESPGIMNGCKRWFGQQVQKHVLRCIASGFGAIQLAGEIASQLVEMIVIKLRQNRIVGWRRTGGKRSGHAGILVRGAVSINAARCRRQ